MAALMIQGVSSDSGKSLLVTALCRWARRRDISVAPFKAQNMSNNARVVDGGEIGVAQWLQARASGVSPDVRMNPVLLKPQSDTGSQVVLNGVANHELTTTPWRERSASLWPHVREAYRSLAAEFDVVLIEGAGSPAETNLWSTDVVNMAVADLADCPVALIADLDRGGAFAHLFGTWALLPEHWRQRFEGFVLNKFRGDPALLDPAPRDLERATGVPVIGVLPWLDHALPDEEGPTIMTGRPTGARISIVCGPYASNLDEFVPLQRVADVRWARSPDELAEATLIILPGSKHVAADLAWLRQRGLVDAIMDASQVGTAILGICGGLQMLGLLLEDADQVEGSARGLGLLPVVTRFKTSKRVTETSIEFGPLEPPWSWLGRRRVSGYEIRHGSTSSEEGVDIAPGGIAFVKRNVLGLYVHGVLEDPEVLRALTGAIPPELDATFEFLADAVETQLDTGWLLQRLPSDS
jgi:adenosylcobyric acid synthase